MQTINELKILADWLVKGHRAAIATVISTWGSAPRPVGSLLIIRDDGLFEGSVSAGCVEGAVIEAALEAIVDGKPRDLSFGVSNETAYAVGLTCGGTIRVHVDPNASLEILQNAIALQKAGQPFIRLFDLDFPGWSIETGDTTDKRSGLQTENGRSVFRHVIAPSPRLIIFGAVHIAQYLAAMAEMAGYEVIVVDPREAYGSKERFSDMTILAAWPNEAFAQLIPDNQTAIVVLTHDPKLDDPALIGALATPACYIAALGSHKNNAARLKRLAEAGINPLQLQRIHGPAGLAIGALSPAEIAISIMAELTATRRGKAEPAARLVHACAS